MAYPAGERVVSNFSMLARVTHAFNLSFGSFDRRPVVREFSYFSHRFYNNHGCGSLTVLLNAFRMKLMWIKLFDRVRVNNKLS